MPKNSPQLSILMGVYNGERFLEETLESIERQTFKDWELIAVDDGSTDNSLHRLREFEEKHPEKVKIFHHPRNQGLTASLIEGAQAARGEFLARSDVGDFFESRKFEKQVEFLKANPDHALVGCQHVNVFVDSGNERPVRLPLHHEEIQAVVDRKNPFSHSSIVMRRDLYEKAGGYNSNVHYGQDYDLWFRLLRLGKGANLDEILCRRSCEEGSISSLRQRAQMIQCLKTQWKYMNRRKPVNYLAMLEPLALIVLPQGFKRWVRKHFR